MLDATIAGDSARARVRVLQPRRCSGCHTAASPFSCRHPHFSHLFFAVFFEDKRAVSQGSEEGGGAAHGEKSRKEPVRERERRREEGEASKTKTMKMILFSINK